jgi:ribosome-associated protein
MTTETGDIEQPKSKTQIKREMTELQKLGKRLLEISVEQLEKLSDQALREAVLAAKKIKTNSARKRQLQFIGKLMRNTDIHEVTELLDQFDNRSRQGKQHFHKIQRWRDALIANDDKVMQEIFLEYPHTDRQHLRHMIRKAIDESISRPGASEYSRKLFRYLRDLEADPANDSQ